MRLISGVHFSLYGDKAYVINLRTGYSYLFNETVFDLLNIIEEYPGITLDSLCSHLKEIYDVENEKEFHISISDCVNDLIDKKIIDDELSHSSFLEQSPEDCINMICIENHILHSVTIELTYRCNERCAHCYVSDSEKTICKELSTQEIFFLLDRLRTMDVLNITFTGGEVTLRSDFLDILRYADQAGFVISIFTNGIGLTEEAIDEIVLLHPRSVSFSIYSGIPEEHEAITGVPGSFNRTLHTMMRLKCAGLMVNVKTPVMRTTIKGFDLLHQMCKQLGFSHQVSYLICTTNKGCTSPTLLRIGDKEIYKRLMKTCSDEHNISSRNSRDINEPICGAAGCCLSINPYGDVFQCNGYCVKLGNIREEDIESIWNGKKTKEISQIKFSSLQEQCLECRYIDDCLYCPGAMLSEMGSIRIPVRETCLIAQAAYELRCERGGQQARG